MRLLAPLLAVAIGLGLLGPSPAAQASPWSAPPRQLARFNPPALTALAWPRPGKGSRSGRAPSAPAMAGPGLQEVAPPGAVQQLRQALAERRPRVTILAPADGTLLAEGPWDLNLQVDDWPLVEAGALGLGPHLLVQLDDQPPQPLVSTHATLPSLAPGSHRLTVMAVRPWGEVVKAPGAWQQIRLHRVAVNPLALPSPGSPQLLPVSPRVASAGEPVLLDWLLLDTPLQNLRSDDTRWRLRVTVNGNSFLVQNQSPLWLKGWRPGSNAVLLELVDGRGEPLNPPFNSLVREVLLDPAAPRAAWLAPRLEAGALAQLLGQAAPAPPLSAAGTSANPASESTPPRAEEDPPADGSGPTSAVGQPTPGREDQAGDEPMPTASRNPALADSDRKEAGEPAGGPSADTTPAPATDLAPKEAPELAKGAPSPPSPVAAENAGTSGESGEPAARAGQNEQAPPDPPTLPPTTSPTPNPSMQPGSPSPPLATAPAPGAAPQP